MEALLLFFIAVVLLFGFVVFFGSPYVPTKRRDIAFALDELYNLTASDCLVDLGSGDGVVLREVSKRGAKAFGVELNPALVFLSQFLSHGDNKVTVVLGNLRSTKFPADTTAVYTFPNTRDVPALSELMQREATRLGRPIVLISYGSEFPLLEHVKSERSHHLYRASPLQDKKPQV